MFEKGDRVSLGTEKGIIYGTVLDVAPDGEPKVQLDGSDDSMYYPVEAVQIVVAINGPQSNVYPIGGEDV